MQTLTLDHLLQDINSTTSAFNWREHDLRPLSGNSWRERKAYAIERLRSRRITRLRRLVLYYWIGKGINQGRTTKNLSPITCRIARRMYNIFSPLGRKQLAYTQHLTPRALGKLHSGIIQRAVDAAKELRDSSIGNVGVESGEVLTSVPEPQFAAPLHMTVEEARDMTMDLGLSLEGISDHLSDHTLAYTSDYILDQVTGLTSGLSSDLSSDLTSDLSRDLSLDQFEAQLPPPPYCFFDIDVNELIEID